jgi:hypothetical protein
MDELIASCGRVAQQRTTLYATVPAGQRERSYAAPTLTPIVLPPAGKRARIQATDVQPADDMSVGMQFRESYSSQSDSPQRHRDTEGSNWLD